MGIKSNITGIVGDLLTFGKEILVGIKRNASALEIKLADDSAFAVLRADKLSTSFGLNDVPSALDLKGSSALIQYGFDGASAPSAGANTAKFGFCHTTGGSYTAGDVVYDDGTTIHKLNLLSSIATTTAITGTISLVANGLYFKESGSWVLKGDGSGTSTGMEKVIELALAYNSSATVDSTTSIPDGARITRVETVVTTAFNGTAPTLAIVVNGSTPLTIMATTLNNLKVANQYQNLEVKEVGSVNAGVVRLNYTADSSSAGAGKVYVYYVSPLA